jgi:hypothetical protein
VLTTFALKFKDYNLINNTLLQEIKKQNLELKRSMETFQVGESYSGMGTPFPFFGEFSTSSLGQNENQLCVSGSRPVLLLPKIREKKKTADSFEGHPSSSGKLQGSR